MEKKRQEKIIGSSLEASVLIETNRKLTLADISSVLIVSHIELKSAKTESVIVERAEGEKCLRCWKFDDLSTEGLCKRCADVVKK